MRRLPVTRSSVVSGSLPLLLVMLLGSGSAAWSQADAAGTPATDTAAEGEVRATLDAFFASMRAGDSATVARLFHPQAELQSLRETARGPELARTPTADFVRAVARAEPGRLDERTARADIRVDGPLATAWVPYAFYADSVRLHCGTNAFTLARQDDARTPWRILRVTDTRRRDGCPDLDDAPALAVLDSVMDAWHHAAAVADEDVFFGTMSADGIYLGTDASERWLRDSMALWAAPYFDRDTAWAFTPRDRHWALSADGRTAWFDELLDGWMGVARGSGVLSRRQADGPWALRHYNLALTVPNARMGAVRLAIDSTAAPH